MLPAARLPESVENRQQRDRAAEVQDQSQINGSLCIAGPDRGSLQVAYTDVSNCPVYLPAGTFVNPKTGQALVSKKSRQSGEVSDFLARFELLVNGDGSEASDFRELASENNSADPNLQKRNGQRVESGEEQSNLDATSRPVESREEEPRAGPQPSHTNTDAGAKKTDDVAQTLWGSQIGRDPGVTNGCATSFANFPSGLEPLLSPKAPLQPHVQRAAAHVVSPASVPLSEGLSTMPKACLERSSLSDAAALNSNGKPHKIVRKRRVGAYAPFRPPNLRTDAGDKGASRVTKSARPPMVPVLRVAVRRPPFKIPRAETSSFVEPRRMALGDEVTVFKGIRVSSFISEKWILEPLLLCRRPCNERSLAFRSLLSAECSNPLSLRFRAIVPGVFWQSRPFFCDRM
jgi:hypothetical protein